MTIKKFLSLFLLTQLLCACVFFSHEHSVKYINYPVQKGDSISSIAERFGVSAAEIVSFNQLSDPAALEVGQIIRIPYPEGGPKVVKPSRKGENMYDIPRDPTSVKALAQNSARKYIGKLAWPLATYDVTSRFGNRWQNFHEGIDLPGAEGKTIFAAHDGVVAYSDDRLKGYGNLIVIRGDNIMTIYAHNSANKVSAGEHVKKGQKIGEVGNTGHSTGPHLHFETRIRNKAGKNAAIDPLAFFPTDSAKAKVAAPESSTTKPGNKQKTSPDKDEKTQNAAPIKEKTIAVEDKSQEQKTKPAIAPQPTPSPTPKAAAAAPKEPPTKKKSSRKY